MYKPFLPSPQTEKHESPSTPSKRSLNVIQILAKSLKISGRNVAVGATILLPVFIFSSLLAFGSKLALIPLSTDLIAKAATQSQDPSEANQKGILEDGGKLLGILFVDRILSFAIWVWFSVATVSLSYEVLNGKVVNAIDLFLKAGGRWKKPVITSFYMALIALSMTFLFLFTIGLVSVYAEGSISVALFSAISIPLVLCYLYWAVVWMLSLVVSVLEDGPCGLKAIERARELMRGKRVQGCVLELVFVLIAGIINWTNSSLGGKIKGDDMKVLMGVELPKVLSLCLMRFFMFVVYTVFYHECRESLEEDGVPEIGFYVYDPVASAEAFGKSLAAEA